MKKEKKIDDDVACITKNEASYLNTSFTDEDSEHEEADLSEREGG